jgi:hypothetical protein
MEEQSGRVQVCLDNAARCEKRGRDEAVAFHQHQRQWGNVASLQPVPAKLIAWLLIISSATVFYFLVIAQYSRKETAIGYLTPTTGTVKIFATQRGTIRQLIVREGQPLLVVETNQIASDGSDVNASMLNTLLFQKELLQKNIIGEEQRSTSENDRLTSVLRGIEEEIARIEGQIKIQEERLRVAQADMTAAEQLRSRGIISEVDFRRRQVQLLEQKQTMAALKSDSSLDRDEVPKDRQPVTPTRAAAQAYCPIEETAAPNLTGYNQSVDLNELARCSAPVQPLPPGIGVIIDEAADVVGLDRSLMRTIAYIESSGNPKNVTGSYKGLFQLSASEFQKYGGGNISDPRDNARAAAFKLTEEMLGFLERYGRNPTPTEIYLTHQQGVHGLANHLANPNGMAWQNMAATAEGQQKGEGWARKAIWGNVPSDLKWQFGSVDNLTSAQFIEVWRRRVERQPHGQASAAIAAIGCCSPRHACLLAVGVVGHDWTSMCASAPAIDPDGELVAP